jgi:hypothetical protein
MGYVRFAGLPLRTLLGLVITPRIPSEKLVAAALERMSLTELAPERNALAAAA